MTSATDPASIEETTALRPRYDAAGLITCVTVDRQGRVLMAAHMNAEALRLTLDTGTVHYWSRSRGCLWRKGDTSGQVQRVVDLRTDCDQDAILARVEVGGDGGACHTGRRSCFYRRIVVDDAGPRLKTVPDPT
ncbi:MAG TPA: phosphoribosyl-AMP cyclohydrolase [Lichenihabitans sp.]|jgi:phosphoribosyl-AMP cyclohydrolase|nr:phosphoribosyl-AMP cyclohydrolase [Lichenihabitans sp.]